MVPSGLLELLLDFAIKITDEAAILDNAEFFELARGMFFGHLCGDRAGVLEDFAIIEYEEGVEALRPVLHGHGDAAFGALLREFEVGIDEAAEGLKLAFGKVVLGHGHIGFEGLPGGAVFPMGEPMFSFSLSARSLMSSGAVWPWMANIF